MTRYGHVRLSTLGDNNATHVGIAVDGLTLLAMGAHLVIEPGHVPRLTVELPVLAIETDPPIRAIVERRWQFEIIYAATTESGEHLSRRITTGGETLAAALAAASVQAAKEGW